MADHAILCYGIRYPNWTSYHLLGAVCNWREGERERERGQGRRTQHHTAIELVSMIKFWFLYYDSNE